MGQYIGHQAVYDVLDRILRAYEAGHYGRLVNYGPGESVLMDSKPAPGYVPGALGKKETGIGYTPAGNGTRLNAYYLAGHKADARQIARCQRFKAYDPHEYIGSVISIRRCKNGNIQLEFVVLNRDERDADGKIMDKLAIDSVSVTREPGVGGGILVALALDQNLGIPFHQLKELLESEKAEAMDANAISASVRAMRDEALNGQATPGLTVPRGSLPVGTPAPTPAPATQTEEDF